MLGRSDVVERARVSTTKVHFGRPAVSSSYGFSGCGRHLMQRRRRNKYTAGRRVARRPTGARQVAEAVNRSIRAMHGVRCGSIRGRERKLGAQRDGGTVEPRGPAVCWIDGRTHAGSLGAVNTVCSWRALCQLGDAAPTSRRCAYDHRTYCLNNQRRFVKLVKPREEDFLINGVSFPVIFGLCIPRRGAMSP